jgi:hypothetical protein
VNFLRDIASERARDFGPRGVDQIGKSRMVTLEDAIKQTTKTKQTKFAAMF